jgi:hypothetical protein
VEFFDVKVVELTKGYLLSADIVFNKYQYKYADILRQLSMLSDCT